MKININYKISSFALLIFLMGLAVPLKGTVYYVDNAAVGSNDGNSWENAWESFASINWFIIEPGDTISISGGDSSQTYFETLVIKVSGTSENPITIMGSHDSGHNGNVIIDGNSMRETAISITARKYINVVGLKITNHTGKDIYISGASGSTYTENGAASYIILDSLEVNVTGRAVFIQTSDNIIVKNSYIYTPVYMNRQTDGIYSQRNHLNTYDNNTIIINNTEPDGHDDGIQLYQDVSITISNNYVEQNNGKFGNAQGIFASNGHGNNLWYNNVVALINGTTSNGIAYRLNIDGMISLIGNTVYCERAFNTMHVENVPDPIIKNNILWNDYLAAPLTIKGWNGNPENIDHNLLYGPKISKGIVMTSDETWLSWKEYKAQGFDAHGINAHPKFVSITKKDFRLQSISPAIDAGATLSEPFDLDKEGTGRPIGSAFDMGAFEHEEITSMQLGNVKPLKSKLGQNYPNPFNPSTVISYILSEYQNVQVKLYNLNGSEISTLVDEPQGPGTHKLFFNGKDLASGVYIYQLRVANAIQSKKMLLLK